MKKARILLAALVLSTVLLFPACSNNNSASDNGTASTASTAAPADNTSTEAPADNTASTVSTTDTPAPTGALSTSDLVGNWQFAINENTIDNILQSMNHSGTSTGLQGLELFTKQELISIIGAEAELITFTFNADGTLSEALNVSDLKDAMKKMYAELIAILKTKDMATAAQVFGAPADQLQSMLDQQGMNWEQYLDAMGENMNSSLDAMTDEMLTAGFGNAKIENGVAQLASCTYRIENDKVIFDDTKSVTTLSYNGTALVAEDVTSSTSETDASTPLSFVKGLELVKVS